ncbi:hypothetical protein IAT38_005493 [Cryptococcus sp. DSM 104549]
MLCIKDIILYSLIFPMPAASPFFLIIFTLALFFALRPCGYCLVLFSILFLSTSPNSPFLNTYTTSPSTSSPPSTPLSIHHLTSPPDTRHLTTPDALSALPLSSPVPYRAWFDFNAGRVWEPRLVGYREMGEALGYEWERKVEERKREVKEKEKEKEARAAAEAAEADKGQAGEVERESAKSGSVGGRLSGFWASFVGRRGPESSAVTVAPESTSHPDPAPTDVAPPPASTAAAPTARKTKPLPPGYLDLRFRGVGFVLDLGWRRTDEGIQWEIEEALGRDWDRSELVVERERRVKARIAREEERRARREMRRAEREKEEREMKKEMEEKEEEERKKEVERKIEEMLKETKEKGREYKATVDRSAGETKVEVEIKKKGIWRRALGKVPLVGSW